MRVIEIVPSKQFQLSLLRILKVKVVLSRWGQINEYQMKWMTFFVKLEYISTKNLQSNLKQSNCKLFSMLQGLVTRIFLFAIFSYYKGRFVTLETPQTECIYNGNLGYLFHATIS